MANLAHPELELEDTLDALIRFESGVVGSVTASTALWPGADVRIEVYGEKGAAIMKGAAISLWQFQDEQPEDQGIRRSGEAGQATLDRDIVQAFIAGHRHRAGGIEDVVGARHIQVDRQWFLTAGTMQHEAGGQTRLFDCFYPVVGVLGKAVGDDLPGHFRQQLPDDRVVHTQHCDTVERQVVHELQIGAAQDGKIAAVGVHVVRLDIGDHGNHGLQVQERCIALVRLGDQESAGAQLGVAADTVDQAADHERGVQTRLGEDIGNQAGSRGFAMGAGHSDAVAIAHQLCQHLGPGHHRNTGGPGCDHLGVELVHCAGADHHIGAADVFRGVADKHPYAPCLEPAGHRARAEVGSGHLIPKVDQHLGNTAHARTADTNHVNPANPAHLRHSVDIALNGHG